MLRAAKMKSKSRIRRAKRRTLHRGKSGLAPPLDGAALHRYRQVIYDLIAMVGRLGVTQPATVTHPRRHKRRKTSP